MFQSFPIYFKMNLVYYIWVDQNKFIKMTTWIQPLTQSRFYTRRPIFQRPELSSSHIWKRQSVSVCLHEGDSACPDQIMDQIRGGPSVYESVKVQGKKKWVAESSSDDQQMLEYKRPDRQIEKEYQSTPHPIPPRQPPLPPQKIPESPRQLDKIKQQRQIVQQSALIDTRIQKLNSQNRFLLNQHFILSQILLSNKNKLNSLTAMQRLETQNVDYKRKMYDAKSKLENLRGQIIEKGKSNNDGSRQILQQLLELLTF